MTSRRLFTPGRAVVCAALIALLVWSARVDVPRLTGGVKGDEASYIAMALSIVHDGDLKNRAEDYQRFRALLGQGPDGVFLKRTYSLSWHVRAEWPPVVVTRTAVPSEQEQDYGKPFIYSLSAAPFVAALGIGGLLFFNLLLLLICWWCAVLFCRARIGRFAGTVLGSAFIFASVVPIYGAWLTPEIFNFFLVLAAYFLWLYKEVAPPDAPVWIRSRWTDLAAAVLLGVATYSKASNALLIGPLALTLLLRGEWRRVVSVAVLWTVATVGLFAITGLIAGDWNYQGGLHSGDRKWFVTHYPFDEAGTQFDQPGVGNPMETNEANDENIFAPDYIARTLPLNAWYFLVGRDAGLVPYYFPGVLICVWWLARVRRATIWQTLTFLAFVGSCLGLLVIFPKSWNGGGGALGNRYFIAIYPTLLFLVPAGAGMWQSLAALLTGAACVGFLFAHPFRYSKEVWLVPEHRPLRWFPIELTIMEDLPVRLIRERGRIPVEKDPEVFLYYMDGNTYNQEADGFWVAGPATADIVIRTALPLTRLDLRLSSNKANEVDISVGGSSTHVSLSPNEEKAVYLTPSAGVHANGYELVWTIRTSAGFRPQEFDPASTDTRQLGVFIKPTYSVASRR